MDNFDETRINAVSNGEILANSTMLSSVDTSVLFMCYPEMQFHIHQQQGPIRSITLSSFLTVEKLRSEVAVGQSVVSKLHSEDLQ